MEESASHHVNEYIFSFILRGIASEKWISVVVWLKIWTFVMKNWIFENQKSEFLENMKNRKLEFFENEKLKNWNFEKLILDFLLLFLG